MAVVLTYHSIPVDAVSNPRLQVTPERLDAQLGWTEALGYRFVPLIEAIERRRERLAAVTFDDGYADLANALPFLERRGIRATVFVCPGEAREPDGWGGPLGADARILSESELLALPRDVVEIAPHGWRHVPVTELDDRALAEDLDRCLAWWTEHVGTKPRVFAYPLGRFDRRTARVAAERFDYAVTNAVRPLRGTPWRYALPRIPCRSGTAEEGFGRRLRRRRLPDGLPRRWPVRRARPLT